MLKSAVKAKVLKPRGVNESLVKSADKILTKKYHTEL